MSLAVSKSKIDLDLFLKIRKRTEELCKPLEIEDYVVQPSFDVSPPKWHLGHTTWFFENFILKDFETNFKIYDESYNLIFNSYYKSQGSHWYQGSRGTLSRPTVSEIFKYREEISNRTCELIDSMFVTNDSRLDGVLKTLAVGLHHEQQHQELLITDIKAILAASPLKPVYDLSGDFKPQSFLEAQSWIDFDGGLLEIGAEEKVNDSFYNSFHFDNEGPRHKVFLKPYSLAKRPVLNSEFIEFIEAGAYKKYEFWLSDAWNLIEDQKITAPLYWEKVDGSWHHYTLSGFKEVDPKQCLTHVNFYEADAFAKWSKKRLPTEAEWENAAKTKANKLDGLLNNLWQWTMCYYISYPGYQPPEGAFGEYNSKFMNNQRVLRGGSVATPEGHLRESYRNFFYPEKNWQYTGIRLAKDN